MANAKEQAKQHLQSIIDTKHSSTSKKIADWYLKVDSSSAFSARGLFRAYPDIFEEMQRRLSHDTVKAIQAMCGDTGLREICEAICDFQFKCARYSEGLKFIADQKTMQRERTVVAESCKKILATKSILSDSARLFIEALHKVTSTKKVKINIGDPARAMDILVTRFFAMHGHSGPGLLGDSRSPEERVELRKALDRAQFTIPRGRPRDLFFKALQIVIFRLLGKEKSVAQRQQLCADIINQSFDTRLKANDIDNALHST